jgi:hypothetical protein
MGIKPNGEKMASFSPYRIVTRAEFGTVLSRALYGDANESVDGFWYQDHLKALSNTVPPIMKNISAPMATEKRGWVMLMLMRVFK